MILTEAETADEIGYIGAELGEECASHASDSGAEGRYVRRGKDGSEIGHDTPSIQALPALGRQGSGRGDSTRSGSGRDSAFTFRPPQEPVLPPTVGLDLCRKSLERVVCIISIITEH